MNQFHFQSPPLSRINRFVLILTGSLFLLFAIMRAVGALEVSEFLGLSGYGLSRGFIFQLLTYPFIETGLFHFIFNGLVLWFIGSELEFQWGEKTYLRFLLFVILGVGIVHSLISFSTGGGAFFYQPLTGLNGINFSLLIAYATLYPHRQMSFMMLFPMTAKTFCWILIGIEVYLAVFSKSFHSLTHLISMLLGYVAIRFQSHPILRLIFHSSQNNMISRVQKMFSKKKTSSNHLRLIKKEDFDHSSSKQEKKKDHRGPKYWQ